MEKQLIPQVFYHAAHGRSKHNISVLTPFWLQQYVGCFAYRDCSEPILFFLVLKTDLGLGYFTNPKFGDPLGGQPSNAIIQRAMTLVSGSLQK